MTDTMATRWPGIAHTPRTPFKARVAKAVVRPAVNSLPVRLTFPDGTVWGAGGPDAPEMAVPRPAAFFSRLGQDTKIGFGEAYMAGDWTTGPGTDLADLLTPFAARLTTIVPPSLQRLRGLVDRQLPQHERNTKEGSRSNIERHYDLSNDLFERFLDPSMTYSSAWFEGPDEPLERAQQRKLDGLLDQAGVGPGTRVLEIGSGWGSLAIRAAQRGAQVTTITISTEQAALAREKFAAAGVADRIDLRLQDYRDVTGEFDAVVSCEMIEAVGEEYWPTYFAKIDEVLAPGGRVSIQAITMAHHRYLTTRNSYGWIQKYIFPGGLIPSPEAIDASLAAHTRGLVVTERRSLGLDYARTLRLWRETFDQRWPEIAAFGFDETFRRLWEFYLAYCEAGFAVQYLDVFQLRMERSA
jgi:cyclopropane-fatty-acyl-phospholipid synthase